MVGTWSAYSSQYVYVSAIGILLGFGLPMLFVPLKFARALRWQIAEPDHLAIYFGRCLGGLASVMAASGFKAVGDPALLPFYYQVTIAAYGILTLTHLYGAIRRIQPITETIEIGFWVGLIVVTLCFYPAVR